MHQLPTLAIPRDHQLRIRTVCLCGFNLTRHGRAARRIAASKIPIDARSIGIHSLNRQGGRAELGIESHDERGPDENANIAGLGGAAGEDEGVSCASAGEFIVGYLLAGQEDEELFEDCEDAYDGGDGSVKGRKVLAWCC